MLWLRAPRLVSAVTDLNPRSVMLPLIRIPKIFNSVISLSKLMNDLLVIVSVRRESHRTCRIIADVLVVDLYGNVCL